MKLHLWIVLSILSLSSYMPGGQARPAEYPSKGVPRSQWLESRQGYPDQTDVIAHQRILKGSHIECAQVEHHPKRADDGAACVLKFENGDKQTLRFNQESEAPVDGEVYLECAGDKPTGCTAWWRD